MPITRPGFTRPLPRPLSARRGRALRAPGSAGSALAQLLGAWNFTAQVYISFDGPNVPLPTWLEVTEFVEIETSTISINHGRQDGLSDVSVGTCALTVDNTDGRWTPSNANGAWFGLIRKGCWLRIDLLPLSGVASRRFTGFITALPTGWQGLYSTAQVRASDRFLLLGRAPALSAMTSAEVIYDSSTGVPQATAAAPGVVAHYPLSEAMAGTGFALAFGDVSGNLNAPLHPIPWGVNATYANYLNYVKTQGATGPGFDGQSCVSFTPAALNAGAILTTTVPDWSNYEPGGNDYGVIELWLQTTFVNTTQPFASLWDPAAAVALVFAIDGATGYLQVGTAATTAASGYTNASFGVMSPGNVINGAAVQAGVVLNDGNWHYISIATLPVLFGPSPPFLVINIDGKTVWIGTGTTNVSLFMDTLTIGGSIAAVGGPECFTGNIAGVSWILTGTRASNYPAHYLAGYNGFTGESVDRRIARVARYAGIPQPSTMQVPAPGYNPVPIYTPGVSAPWTNLGSCVHLAGPQSIAGRQPLDVMREAARTENMPLFIDRNGNLTIQPCTTRYNTTPAWSVDARDLDPATQFSDDFTYLINQMTVTPNGGATQTINGAAGTASQKKYGLYNQPLATASLNTTEAANVGLAQISANADPAPRVTALVIEAATLAGTPGYGAAWYDAVLATEISTVLTVTNLPPQAPASALSVVVEGYTETIGAGQHVFSYSTSPQVNTSVLQLDSATLGKLDTSSITLGY